MSPLLAAAPGTLADLAGVALAGALSALAVVLAVTALRRRGRPAPWLLWLGTAALLALAAAQLSAALPVRVPAAGATWAAAAALAWFLLRLSPGEAEAERCLQELRDSEAQMRAMVETAADVILTLDDNGVVQSVNRACRKLFGLEPEEMVGQGINRFLASGGLGQGGVGTGEAKVFGLSGEALGRRKDGTTFPVSVSLSKIRTRRGPLLAVIVHDLSDLKKTEEELRHSETRLRVMLDQVPAILCSTDCELRITLLTCSMSTGLSGLGRQLSRFVGEPLPGSEAALRFLPADAFRRALRGESAMAEVRWEDRTLEFQIEPLRGKANRIVGTVGVGLDVTERKRNEMAQEFYAAQLRERNEQLLRSNQELDEFAYVASHDLKEPLRGIHNYASFLLEDYADRLDASGRARLETLKQLSQRMDALIDSLLHFSRVGRVELAMQETDLNEVVAEVLASLQISLEEKGVEVRFDRTLPAVRCDRVRIAEVFRNLIVNAVKYNDKPHKWVEIGVTDAPPQPQEGMGGPEGAASRAFYVRDNGIGIPPQHWEVIFRIFKRLHGRDRYGGGTGAGLTIVKKVVERHGGRVWLDSIPGEGTTFYFTLGEKSFAAAGMLIR